MELDISVITRFQKKRHKRRRVPRLTRWKEPGCGRASPSIAITEVSEFIKEVNELCLTADAETICF